MRFKRVCFVVMFLALSLMLFSAGNSYAATTVSTTGGAVAMVQNQAAVIVDSGVTVVNDLGNITGGTVSITSGFASGDTLACTNSGPITCAYNATTGILTFTGTDTPANWQAIFRTVTIATTSASATARTVAFTIGSSIPYSGNNHFYEYISTTGTWPVGKAAAAARTLFNLQGYLATITSQGENDFIQQKLGADAWIGASDEVSVINAATGAATYANQAAAEGHWYWVTGPAGEIGINFSNGNTNPVVVGGQYMNWNASEPNNWGGAEHYGEIYSSGASPGKWNDLLGGPLGYVVEYGGMAGDPLVTLTASRTVNNTASSFTVTPSAGAGGSISPSTPQNIPSGSTTTFTVTPNAGYSISSVGGTCGGNLVGTTYTTNAITANCTVSASFIYTYTVTPSAGAGGSISPSTPQTINSGSTTQFIVTPNSGYIIASVTGCGGALSGNTYTTGAITSNCTVTASFTQNGLLSINPSAIAFLDIKAGTRVERQITVSNVGLQQIIINGFSITGSEAQHFTYSSLCSTVPAGGSCVVTVVLNAPSAGSATALSGNLLISSNDTLNPQITVPLTATVSITASPQITVNPSAVNLAHVDIEMGANLLVTIINTGTGTLIIEQIALQGRDKGDFIISGSCPEITAGNTCQITVKTNYTSTSAKEASIAILSNAVNTPKVEIPISAASGEQCAGGVDIGDRSRATVSSTGYSGTITVTSSATCWWKAASEVEWITVDGVWIQGSATVGYTVAQNSANRGRIGRILLAGRIYTIVQLPAAANKGAASGTSIFGDTAGLWSEDYINAFYAASLTNGCQLSPLLYCPSTTVTREVGAIFIIRGFEGDVEDGYCNNGAPFTDVSSNSWTCGYIKRLSERGITGGCNTGAEFCPEVDMTREMAAAWIVRGFYGEDFSYQTTPYFTDVPSDSFYFKYVQKLKELEITKVSGSFYPGQSLTREEMAIFGARVFLGME